MVRRLRMRLTATASAAPMGTAVAAMPSIRDCGPHVVLTAVKSCWTNGAERMTATEAVTATMNRKERIKVGVDDLARFVRAACARRHTDTPTRHQNGFDRTARVNRTLPVYFRCLLTSLVISNILTVALPPNTGFRAASALII